MPDDDPYSHVSKGKLKIKGDHGIKKKKKKNKDKKMLEQVEVTANDGKSEEKQTNQPLELRKTKAELTFLKMKEKMVIIIKHYYT